MKRVAIVGSGIAGMSAARLLYKNHEVCVFEQNARVGGHTNTARIDIDGRIVPVDTGFIVFNFATYPNFKALLEHLDVEIAKSDMSFGVSLENEQLEYSGSSLSGFFCQHKNIISGKFWRFGLDILQFNRHAQQTNNLPWSVTLDEYLDTLNLSKEFRRWYLYPIASSIWSTPSKEIGGFPAQSFLTFFQNHKLLNVFNQHQWYTVKGGSIEYLKQLIAPFENRIRLNNRVTEISINNGLPVVNNEVFDIVILCCAADISYGLVKNISEEYDVLKNIRYSRNTAVLHSDSSMMPRNKKAWASWVYRSCREDKLSLTYWMNKLQPLNTRSNIFVTLNPNQKISEEKVFSQYEYYHPLYNVELIEAQKSIDAIQGKNNIWFSGSYIRNGFHEDALVSSINVVKSLGVDPIWD